MTMEHNPYQAPTADALTAAQSDTGYYVVSPRKFTILFFATLGLYGIYWFYKNWAAYRDTSGENIWPAPRAIFSIFFVHALFGKFEDRLRERSLDYDWRPKSLATQYVIFTIVSSLLDRLSSKGIGTPITDLLSLAILPVLYYLMLIPQKVVNRVEGDEQGESNDRLSGGNIFWILIGLVGWLLVAFGLLLSFGVINLDA